MITNKKLEQLGLSELLKDEFIIDTQNIVDSLNNLQDSIDASIKSILDKIQIKIANKQFDITAYSKAVTRAEDIKDDIQDLVFFLTCSEAEKNNWKIKNISLPSAFKVDPSIEHSLNESLQHKTPYGFSVNRGAVIRAESWKHLLYKVCEYFFIMDEKLFLSFIDKKHMNGRSTKYFSTNPNDIINPMSINGKVYIKSMKSLDIIKGLIIKILDEYNCNIDDFILYLDSDYSGLNK